MFNKEVYIHRREKLKSSVGNGLILFLGNEESSMSYKDNLYPFRQDSSFLYYFGIDRPGLFALIDIDQDEETMFGETQTEDDIVWTGYQESLTDISDKIGIGKVEGPSQLASIIQQAQKQARTIHYLKPYRPEHTLKLSALLGTNESALLSSVSINLVKAIVAQRSIKAPEELVEIEKGVNMTVDMQRAAMNLAREGMTEAMIAGELQKIAIANGGNLSFPTILTVNGEILHNHFSTKLIKKDNLLLCDCGAETAMHYAGDLTRTFPVSGSFSNKQREIYQIVYDAETAAAGILKPGILFRDVHLFACLKLVEGLQQLGLMKGNAKEAVEAGAHTLFFPCGLGHMMGLDVHDMENLGEQYVGYTEDLMQSKAFGLKSLRLGRSLEPGFVITVEPGIYFNPYLMDIWESKNKCRDFINYDKLKIYRDFGGVRIEEDFLVTEDGHHLLGKALAKLPEEIEAIRSKIE
ncbi:MAG: aminopeptidase P family protein [Bacteroidetes bacterium]|nr:aminopeptidase P family protein [Bacteroidota bacterium]